MAAHQRVGDQAELEALEDQGEAREEGVAIVVA
jgi:hypothetical protein